MALQPLCAILRQQGKRKPVAKNTSACRSFGNKPKKGRIGNPAIAQVTSSRKNNTTLALAGNIYTNTKPDGHGTVCTCIYDAEFLLCRLSFTGQRCAFNNSMTAWMLFSVKVHDAMQVLWVCSAQSLLGVWYRSDKFDFPLWNQLSLPTFISILALPLT